MLKAGAAAGTGRDLMLLCGIQELLLQNPIEVLRRGLVIQLILPDVVVVLCELSLCLTPLQSGNVVVMVVVMMIPAVGSTVCPALVMLIVVVQAVAVAVLVQVAVMMVDPVMKKVLVAAVIIANGLLWVQWGPFALGCRAVLPNLVDEENLGHVVDDEHFSPVRDWLGLSATEMNVHDEDGERSRGCDHSHGGDIVFPLGRKQRKRVFYEQVLVNGQLVHRSSNM